MREKLSKGFDQSQKQKKQMVWLKKQLDGLLHLQTKGVITRKAMDIE